MAGGRKSFPPFYRKEVKPAILVLEDGSVFRGRSIGIPGTATGEVVFNTAMTGYQEILTDPSYARQIITLTYPHIGNTGTNEEDMEKLFRLFRQIVNEMFVAYDYRKKYENSFEKLKAERELADKEIEYFSEVGFEWNYEWQEEMK